MDRGSTYLLRAVIWIIGLVVAGLCVFGLPQLLISELEGDFDYGWIFVGMYVTAIPFFYGALQALKLLSYIDANKAFTAEAVTTLRKIKYAAFTLSGLYMAGMPYIFYMGDKDDAPGVVAIGFVIIGASFVLGTAVAVFQRLFQNAVDIKTENDLTV